MSGGGGWAFVLQDSSIASAHHKGKSLRPTQSACPAVAATSSTIPAGRTHPQPSCPPLPNPPSPPPPPPRRGSASAVGLLFRSWQAEAEGGTAVVYDWERGVLEAIFNVPPSYGANLGAAAAAGAAGFGGGEEGGDLVGLDPAELLTPRGRRPPAGGGGAAGLGAAGLGAAGGGGLSRSTSFASLRVSARVGQRNAGLLRWGLWCGPGARGLSREWGTALPAHVLVVGRVLCCCMSCPRMPGRGPALLWQARLSVGRQHITPFLASPFTLQGGPGMLASSLGAPSSLSDFGGQGRGGLFSPRADPGTPRTPGGCGVGGLGETGAWGGDFIDSKHALLP